MTTDLPTATATTAPAAGGTATAIAAPVPRPEPGARPRLQMAAPRRGKPPRHLADLTVPERKEAAKEAQHCAEKLLAAQKSHDAVAKEAAAARETAARLSGQLEAVQVRNAALLETLRGKVAGNG